ncbi:MAG: N-acetylhexosamine 1-kinase [Lentisphaerae bacterium ADurb.BinA184]|nr:MAG: N-acetylhexosamine 1-kinase [Lentisphaerae bacterium ADurb.BinA184]
MTAAHFNLREVTRAFAIHGDWVDGAPYGSGHINDTFAVRLSQGGTVIRYILQRINHRIFKDVPGLMANIVRVTGHCAHKLAAAGCPDATRRGLTVVPTRDGQPFHTDADGSFWRAYVFIEGAHTYDVVESPAQACAAARAFGDFQRTLADLPPPALVETIPGFHDTRRRFEAFQKALAADRHHRARDVRGEIAFVEARADIVGRLVDLQRAGRLPERTTHNDTKLNNVLLDDGTGEGVCVIDLDTVMPGLVLYDFGDMVRTAARPTPEDERDLSRVVVSVPMFEALARGYLASAGAFLTPCEREHLAFSARLISFEIGLRFLTDHLDGDAYFKIHRPGHNLDRCRVQFAMVRSIEEHSEEMEAIVAAAAGR